MVLVVFSLTRVSASFRPCFHLMQGVFHMRSACLSLSSRSRSFVQDRVHALVSALRPSRGLTVARFPVPTHHTTSREGPTSTSRQRAARCDDSGSCRSARNSHGTRPPLWHVSRTRVLHAFHSHAGNAFHSHLPLVSVLFALRFGLVRWH